jgi:ribonuclease HI
MEWVGKPYKKEFFEGFRLTTNNRMELRAAIAALQSLREPCAVELHSDSKYLIDAISKNWIEGWKKRGWKTAAKQAVKNQDLWLLLLAAMAGHKIDWLWVKGHAGHRENERCDELANIAVAGKNLQVDEGFTMEAGD